MRKKSKIHYNPDKNGCWQLPLFTYILLDNMKMWHFQIIVVKDK